MEIKDTDLVVIRNRNNGMTGYTLDNNFHRDFAPMESKKVPFSEIKALSFASGGKELLEDYFVIEDKDVLDLLNMTVEPEYFYDEAKVKELLLTGNIDEFADFLDFAPEGAIEIAKAIAVKEEIPDVRKRDMLSERTGLNINNAIMINHIMEDESAEEPAPKQRTVQKEEPKAEPAPKRRVPDYKVVAK